MILLYTDVEEKIYNFFQLRLLIATICIAMFDLFGIITWKIDWLLCSFVFSYIATRWCMSRLMLKNAHVFLIFKRKIVVHVRCYDSLNV